MRYLIGAVVLFLNAHGVKLEASASDIVDFCAAVAEGQMDVSKIPEWLEARSHRRA